MKTGSAAEVDRAAPIVRLIEGDADAAADGAPGAEMVAAARAFTVPLVAGECHASGEDVLGHADGVAGILQSIGAAPSLAAAAYLIHAAAHLGKPDEAIGKAFDPSQATLVAHARQLMQIERAAASAQLGAVDRARQTERVRKMLLAFSRDLRVVLVRLASRLQGLRHHAASRTPCPRELAEETLQVFAPLANRLGIWQIKWELEDLAFRFLDPGNYKAIAALLDERRAEREMHVEALRRRLGAELAAAGIEAEVQGRPKHIYSIWKKMRSKGLAFDAVLDVRALRVIVADVADCYAVLGRVHELYRAIPGELDDYIANPKPNGYQSLHTVVADSDGRHVEIQIRTRAMHEHAEFGVSAHWVYKEAGPRANPTAVGEFAARIAAARLVVLRQLLAWERDLVGGEGAVGGAADASDTKAPAFDDRIYVFTPQAAIVELTAGATPIDFAYAVHTELGHRCRGAKADGVMIPLNTPLRNGQTVEITVAKAGGPSLDWLNPELGFIQSARSRAKVRAWFNAQAQAATVARGREAVERLLQREGRTALKHADLAAQLGFRSADALFEVVGKDELSLRSIENLLRPPEPAPTDVLPLRRSRAGEGGRGGVLVVGDGSLLTSLGRCCRPAPPDPIGGYVTRGKGVAVHRTSCSNFRQMAARMPERVIDVAWGAGDASRPSLYPIDIGVEAHDRPGLLRDISEALAKEKMNVVGVTTQAARDGGSTAALTFTVEIADANRVGAVLAHVASIAGVRSVRRK
ncbi:RelA/SpoT family protein [Piscinibacter koreensis]|uniref:GTP pyrophosphokinase n=1 Tax=Piscinibacter koreensis TaxID=2742824 RepID=A0A7Y6NQZ5_9BURK|nr:RelA/SpoT family protein [Schlegelella koreensis]NUZ07711.1 bifunctional (p)ppGpp synthetase/guanosine-3',5'-bis(diphosphate) 3'-pyrophosphohydrolase [Schlegelella koreensis]